MKIVIINHSDSKGGASVVSYRLMRALRQLGVDARMLVVHKATDDPYVELAAPAWRSRLEFYREAWSIARRNGFKRSTLFKFSVGAAGLPLHRHKLVKEADALLLSWVNQGMLSYKGLQELGRLGKPIFWTMHDMWNFTGACHHSGTCTAYEGECGNCPILGKLAKPNDLSHWSWTGKSRAYSGADIRFIAVSTWLAERARASKLLSGRPVTVIPNAFPVEEYSKAAEFSRADLGLPEATPLIAMGAACLDDPIKNLPMAIKALNLLANKGVRAHAVFFGWVRHPEIFEGLLMPHTLMGTIGERQVHSVFVHSSVVISSSDYETLPGTLIEGQAAGAVPVSFGRGGQGDIIDHQKTGYIARYGDAGDFAAGIEWALSTPPAAEQLRENVVRRFSARSVAAAIVSEVQKPI